MASDPRDRTQKIEEALGFAEHAIEQFSEEFAHLRPVLAKLEQRLAAIERRLSALEEPEDASHESSEGD